MNTLLFSDINATDLEILDHIPIGILHINVDGIITFSNSKSLAILEEKKENIEGQLMDKIPLLDVSGKPIDKATSPIFNVLQNGISIEGERLRFEQTDGYKELVCDLVPLFSTPKEVCGCLLTFKVSDSQMKLEEQSEERDRYSNESVNAGFWEYSIREKKMTFVGEKVKGILGYSIEERSEEGFWENRIHPNDKGWVVPYHQEQVRLGKSHEYEYRFRKKDGEYIWIRDVIDVEVEDGEPILLRGLMVDISDQRTISKRLVESEMHTDKLVKEAPFSISIYNMKGILVNANEAFNETWQLNKKELIGKFNIFKEKKFTEKSIQTAIKKAFKGQKGAIVTKIDFDEISKDFSINYFPLLDTSGQLSRVVFVTEDITARTDAEHQAKIGEALKQEILNSLDDAILVVDKDGAIISINKRLEIYLKKSPYNNVSVGGNVFSFIDFFEDKELVKSGFERVLNRSATFFDYETKLADNKWYNLKVTQLKKPYGAVISWQNINTRKEIEIALEKSLKKYRNIYNRAPVMMHSINSKAEIMSVSDFWLEKMGYERKEVIGRKTLEFVTEETTVEAKKKIKDFFKKGYAKNEPYQFRTKDGEILEVLLSATSEYDDDGKFERSLAGMVDVTELKNTERQLVENRKNLLEAQRISKIGNYELNLLDDTLVPSTEVNAMMGLSKKDRDISVLDKLLHVSDKEEFFQKLRLAARSGEDFFHIFRINHLKSKRVRWISARGKIRQNESGVNYKMIGTFQDISEQKVAEDKIRRLSDRILLATELAEIGVWEYSSDTQEVYWDLQMHEIFETTSKPIENIKELEAYVVKEDKALIDDIVAKIEKGARFIECDLRLQINDQLKYVRTYTRIIREPNSDVTRFIGVMYDNTTDKELQLKLENSLEEKNVLLKEVHHRVKNNMQLVSSILALKSYDLKDSDAKNLFSEINDRIKSMAVIHDQLYKFYNVSEINIAEYLNHIAGELRILFGTTETSIEVDSDDIVFEVDKALLFGLIVSELVSNAFKHSFNAKKKGVVNIIFKRRKKKNFLSVLNSGQPIPKNILEEKSIGLGISLIKTFARQLNGELTISSKNGFQIEF